MFIVARVKMSLYTVHNLVMNHHQSNKGNLIVSSYKIMLSAVKDSTFRLFLLFKWDIFYIEIRQ